MLGFSIFYTMQNDTISLTCRKKHYVWSRDGVKEQSSLLRLSCWLLGSPHSNDWSSPCATVYPGQHLLTSGDQVFPEW